MLHVDPPALFQDAVGVSVGPVGVPGGVAGGGGGGRRHCRQPGSGLALSRDNFILFMNRSSTQKHGIFR
jgi:hypothetical protein